MPATLTRKADCSSGALVARPEIVEYILLEASGVADPGRIFITFNDANLWSLQKTETRAE
jgi:G3E family GTPase